MVKGKYNERNKTYYEKHKKEVIARSKRNYLKNKGKFDEYRENYRKENREKAKKYSKKYYKNNKTELLKKRKVYCDKNKSKRNKHTRERKQVDIAFKLKTNLRTHIAIILKKTGYTKKSKLTKILGCTYEEYRLHLESKFLPWMNWDNYGKYNGELDYGWDIDHIIPLSRVNTEEDILKLFHFRNTQPLCSKVNRNIKKDNV